MPSESENGERPNPFNSLTIGAMNGNVEFRTRNLSIVVDSTDRSRRMSYYGFRVNDAASNLPLRWAHFFDPSGKELTPPRLSVIGNPVPDAPPPIYLLPKGGHRLYHYTYPELNYPSGGLLGITSDINPDNLDPRQRITLGDLRRPISFTTRSGSRYSLGQADQFGIREVLYQSGQSYDRSVKVPVPIPPKKLTAFVFLPYIFNGGQGVYIERPANVPNPRFAERLGEYPNKMVVTTYIDLLDLKGFGNITQLYRPRK
jgi:hypothetical protein